jgi:hypothetical protein
MTIDLLRSTVFRQQTTQDTHTTNPEDLDRDVHDADQWPRAIHLRWHTSISCTLSFTMTHVSTLAASFVVLTRTETRVNGDGFLDDQTVFDELSHALT